MKYRYILLFLVLSVMGFGCSDDKFYKEPDKGNADGELVQAYLKLSVSDFNVISDDTRAAIPSTDKETASEQEKQIDNIWVFQYGADGNELMAPVYYEITEQEQLDDLDKIDVLLKEGTSSTICVVANTYNKNWVQGDGFKTLAGLKSKAISDPVAINLFTEFKPIPMEGSIPDVNVSSGSTIVIPVYRMYAKLKITFDNLVAGMKPKSIQVQNIPNYCQVQSLGKDLAEETPATYDIDEGQWITRAVNTVSGDGAYTDGKEYAVYIPENLQGEQGIQNEVNKSEITEDNESERVPGHALIINLEMNYEDPTTGATKTLNYKVYPGSNMYNNFNIKRNCVYRVKININSASQANYTPSSNCFVVIPGETLSFEPYYRVETGGQYGDDADMFKFNTYLDPNDPTKDKVIDRVQILWQTKNAIGDNTKGDLVQFKLNEKYPLHSEIIVKTNRALKTSDDESTRSGEPTYIKTDGNALIGAFNEKGDIIWSWHIWITDKDPGNVGNAVVYTTYRWEGDKIVDGETVQGKIYSYAQGIEDNQVYDRVPGYAVMPCNLGALDFTPKTNNAADIARTFGMLYQWGRKDPFPPSINPRKGDFEVDYSENEAGVHYDYSNDKNVRKTYTQDATFPFHTKLGKDLDNPIVFSINNPLVFINGLISDQANHTKLYNYFARGDWMETHNNKLWGGLDPTSEGLSKLTISGPIIPEGKYIYNNYGDKKTIYDPCPSGWRVPPGDLWLGFTKNGTNPSSNDDINYDVTSTNNTHFGMYLYLQKSKWDTDNPGKTLFFPTQGIRISTGQLKNTGQCGNYHNATSNDLDEVNVLHVHNDWARFHLFEFQYIFYNVKSIAGPIRCVRDRK